MKTRLASHTRRASVRAGLVAVPFGLASAAIVFAVAAWLAGPTATPAFVVLPAVLVALSLLSPAFAYVRARRGHLRDEGASLLDGVSPRLGERTRVALDMVATPPRFSGSRDLADALVAAELARVPDARVVDFRRVFDRRSAAAALAIFVVVASMGLSTRMRLGAYALLHPATVARGIPEAAVVDSIEAEITPPAYRRAPMRRASGPRFEAPEGARVRVRVHMRVPGTEALLRPAGAEVRLREVSPDTWEGTFTARRSGALHVRVRGADGWLDDAAARSIRVVTDEPPRVALELPGAATPVEASAVLEGRFQASDDVGLVRVEFVVLLPSGEERRSPLTAADQEPKRASGAISISPSQFALLPGDSVSVWVEARDADDLDGPNVSRSAVQTVVVRSTSDDRDADLTELRALLDAAIIALADRLEKPVADGDAARDAAVDASAQTLVDGLVAFAARGRERAGVVATDVELVSAMASRTRSAVSDVIRARGSLPAHVAADARVVSVLEDVTLDLADVLARSSVSDAAAIAREIAAIQREIAALIEAMRSDPSPQRREALLAAISRAESRLRELANRLATMGDEVPSEHRNAATSAVSGGEADEDPIAAMREAIARGDFVEANRQLAALEQRVRDLARSLDAASESSGGGSVSERERALAEALAQLSGLETEQFSLSDETTRVRRSMTERALESGESASAQVSNALAERAARGRAQLDELARRSSTPYDRQEIERARARLRDAEQALRNGDLGEGESMLESAANATENVARDLEISAMMFPGQGGRTLEAARIARSASDAVQGLHGDAVRAIPSLREQMRAAERQALAEGLASQRRATAAAERIAGVLEQEADGAPLSAQAAQQMRGIAGTMREAESALGRENAIDASASQQRAAQAIRELRESLEQSESGGGGGGGGGSGQDGADQNPGEVVIPGRQRNAEVEQLRRRVLDAMSDDVPPAYRGAVQRYYEELLR